jgi:hypothetical protein
MVEANQIGFALDKKMGGVRAVATVDGKQICLDNMTEKSGMPTICRKVSGGSSLLNGEKYPTYYVPETIERVSMDSYGGYQHGWENLYSQTFSAPIIRRNWVQKTTVPQELYAQMSAAVQAELIERGFHLFGTMANVPHDFKLEYLEGIDLINLNDKAARAVQKIMENYKAFPDMPTWARSNREREVDGKLSKIGIQIAKPSTIDYSSILR